MYLLHQSILQKYIWRQFPYTLSFLVSLPWLFLYKEIQYIHAKLKIKTKHVEINFLMRKSVLEMVKSNEKRNNLLAPFLLSQWRTDNVMKTMCYHHKTASYLFDSHVRLLVGLLVDRSVIIF